MPGEADMAGKTPAQADRADETPATENLAREIDAKIRALYSETVEEGVPDRFAKLLEELRNSEGGK
jgi:hypothetical protein